MKTVENDLKLTTIYLQGTQLKQLLEKSNNSFVKFCITELTQ